MKSKDKIVIRKKAFPFIASLAGISVVLIARNNPAVILLWIGVVIGFFIRKNM